jgi:hypothetical protein
VASLLARYLAQGLRLFAIMRHHRRQLNASATTSDIEFSVLTDAERDMDMGGALTNALGRGRAVSSPRLSQAEVVPPAAAAEPQCRSATTSPAPESMSMAPHVAPDATA